MYIRAPKRGRFNTTSADAATVRAGDVLFQYDDSAETNLLAQLNAAVVEAQRTQDELGSGGKRRDNLIGVADAGVARANSRRDATALRLEVNQGLLKEGKTVHWLVTQSEALHERAIYELVKAECERRIVEHSADEAVATAKSLSTYLEGAIDAAKEQIAALRITAPIGGKFHLARLNNPFSEKGEIIGSIS